ncbi:DUF1549 and DUF1553 domain-containing protein [Arenibacter sp. ARW7G5Y1]|uniref:DUF1549 and DUF1553 domain-containing protein n=1 Tax=Arenibacter sp. ARW7G5Y1 TaxID=2135619 RepID=UPI0021ABB8E2|nr:DUF1549 and DUF1553 domain-containing protein [Arenibacter sp. ARW7G5Y1]
MDEKGLEKVPPATKNSLIRRVSYLLTGLPPNPKEVKNFLLDTSSVSYEKMVDRYLNSPAYGERWARHWMDLVRYAETKGHEFDYAITGAWKYRDYLIRAFNEDVPYDQFLKEHIAGDLLQTTRENKETGVSESRLGTTFYVMGEGTHSPVDVRQDEADRIDNMIDVTTKTFQGLTVSCAKCHDHKFDPITAADYYALYGVMESTRFSPVPADLSKDKKLAAQEIENLNSYMRKLVAGKWDRAKNSYINTEYAQNTTINTSAMSYTVIGDFRGRDFDGWTSDGFAFGQKSTLGNPIVDPATGKLLGLDEGKASSRSMGMGIFGALRSPNFILEKDFIGVRALGKNSSIRIIIDNFQLIQNPIYGGMDQRVNTEEWNNFIFNVRAWKGRKAYIEILPGTHDRHRYNLTEDAFIEAQYAVTYDGEWPLDLEKNITKQPSQDNWASLEISPFKVIRINDDLKKGKLTSNFPELKAVVDSSRLLAKSLKNVSFVNGIYDGYGINSPIFNRGNYKEPSEEHVPRRFLSVLSLGDSVFKSEGSGRLELAEVMLDKDNPLTSRVMVNRIWHHLFGKGIVETVDNFGLQGKLPSHPELLDYLAVKFQQEGWSVKKLIRAIVTSETFKRSDALANTDPNNIYLASFPVRRLEAEAIRDGILAVSESLDSTMYGTPVPTHLTAFMQGRGRPGKSGPIDGEGRRSIYLEVRRNFLEPMMTTFDRPIPFSTFGRRNVTNVPSQSLILMNDPLVAQQAEIMAGKLMEKGLANFEEKVQWIYMQAFSRLASREELKKASNFFGMLQEMEEKMDGKEKPEMELWKEYCHSIFNLKEFIYLI